MVMKSTILFFCLFGCLLLQAQQYIPGETIMQHIKTTQLFPKNNQLAYPIITLGETNSLELHFDDMERNYKNYFYTYQLCDADWQPVQLSAFDYIKGFQQNRLTQYRNSAIVKTNYIHYQAILPEKNCMPSKSGNYLLKVFVNGDTNQLAFTKKMLVVEPIVNIGAQVKQTFFQETFRTHQKIQLTVNKQGLNVINPQQQIKLVILQNYRWDNALQNIQPTFIKESTLEYNTERDCVFPAGKEYRWLDLRSFRFQSERMGKTDLTTTPFSVNVLPDPERTSQRYVFFLDRNGFAETAATDVANAWWQGDYANVHFTFVPKNNQPFIGEDVYIGGQFTNYQYNNNTVMKYNAEKGVYELDMLLKQGYYTYNYYTKDKQNASIASTLTDGNYWETENDYTILIYFRSINGRHDELVGCTTVNARNSRIGF